MSDGERQMRLAELDRILNDPDVPMQAARVWSLLAELSPRVAGGETSVLSGGRGLG